MLGVGDCCGGWARWCAGTAGGWVARVVRLLPAAIHRAPRRCLRDAALLAARGAKTGFSASVLGCRSRTRAKFGRRTRLIREKVIGRSMRGFSARFMAWSPLVVAARSADRGHRMLGMLAGRGTFALLHQPARQHGGGVLLEPGVQQLRDLLAEIGRVAKPRKLIALQRIAGRREKELPRRQGLVIQRGLQGKRRHIISVVTTVNSTHLRKGCGKLWKSLAWNCEQTRFASARVRTL
jgi:hypothetical protein